MASVWDSVVGQGRAVEQLQHAAVSPVHAYLLVGTEGCGKEEASRAFAAMMLSGSDNPTERINEMAMRGAHPDIHEVRRDGASILKEQAEDGIRDFCLSRWLGDVYKRQIMVVSWRKESL